LGAALFTWYTYLDNPRTLRDQGDMQQGSYLGPAYSDSEIEQFLKKNEIVYRYLPTEEVPETVAELIATENVIGWFQGRMEFGPRALGSRSIIGDARSPKMQSVMNLKIKFRESFRPFAPSILIDRVSEYFEIDRESPYMLLVAPVVKEKRVAMSEEQERLFGIEKLNVVRSEVPAVTHIDYSARIQTVHRETNPLYYDMINAFYKKTGCPAIINTSYNVRGEPIVCRPEEAYRCFMRTHMDYLVMGNYLIAKTEQKVLSEDSNWMKEFELD
jgi:carbamoyltransferase